MRPLDKGPAPRTFRDYADAIGPLEARLGRYCAYCEIRIEMGLEVEHVVPKSLDPTLRLEWENFLPACKCCNTVKGKKPVVVSEYLWPDRDNTALAFEYDLKQFGIPNVSTALSADDQARAAKLISLVELDHIPKPRDRERTDKKTPLKVKRWRCRRDVLLRAEKVAERYFRRGQKDADAIADVRDAAVPSGCWSVWMTVFAAAPEVRRGLMAHFPNTAKCFDDETQPIARKA